MEMKFRDLRADEIDCRVATAKKNGVSLLLYKDARCDMNILDETIGPMNWTRSHSRDNANCTVSIWDDAKAQWISKEDTGTESNTEKEKGLASDSFKRACFNWGIGRELYTAPFIWVKPSDCDIVEENGRMKCFDRFTVESIQIQDKKIVGLSVLNNSKGKICFRMIPPNAKKIPVKEPEPDTEPDAPPTLCEDCGHPIAPRTMKSGRVMTVAEIATKTTMKYGRQLCIECWKKVSECE